MKTPLPYTSSKAATSGCFRKQLYLLQLLLFYCDMCKMFQDHCFIDRSSHQRSSVNLAKFIRRHLCQSLFYNKVVCLKPTTLLKMTLAQVFSCEFWEILRTTFLTEHPWRLLLYRSPLNSCIFLHAR